MENPLQISLSLDTEGDSIFLNYTIKNNSGQTVHIFDSDRMPYRIREADGSLTVLYGVNAPDPDIDYNFIEIPLTQPMAAGEEIEGVVSLRPLFLGDHYGKQNQATTLTGKVTLHFQAAWGKTPILKANRVNMSINTLLTWQQLSPVVSIEGSF